MRRSIHTPTRKELLQGLVYTIIAFLFIFVCASFQECRAQTVSRKGYTFYQQQSSNKIAKDSAVFSGYHYVDTKGVRYPIYISSKGKCFIYRVSSKTNKRYKMYLPEITRQLAKK